LLEYGHVIVTHERVLVWEVAHVAVLVLLLKLKHVIVPSANVHWRTTDAHGTSRERCTTHERLAIDRLAIRNVTKQIVAVKVVQ
jgi:hypothetical protein